MAPPRLTGALRSFSNVSKQDYTEDIYDLKSKRLKRQEQLSKDGLTWQKITQFFSQHLEKGQQHAAQEELKKILQAARQIVGTEFGQEAVESAAVFLFRTFYGTDQGGDGARVADRASFGRNIAFSFDSYALDYQESPPWGEDDGRPGQSFSLDFHKFLNNQQDGRGREGQNSAPGRPAQGSGNGDAALLRREVEQYLSGGNMDSTNAEDLCTSLFEMLASQKTDDELQNELFELLGPEGFEMIERLLQHRADIVDSLLTSLPDQRLGYLPEAARKGSGDGSKPAYGCQEAGEAPDDADAPPDPGFHFDPKELRLHREQALLTARRSPVLGRQREYERIRYPHVYDAYAEAAKTSAFVGGAKMLLPEGIKRENNKMFEEVVIPPNEPMPIGFEEKPVYISELDEVGQLVFQGMNRLNRIQSIVFETAYNTNENMLICAPTAPARPTSPCWPSCTRSASTWSRAASSARTSSR
ncbi:hypothetical protein ANANG_G00012670 [Anguilla anguilla]|uniref:Activating signal cointegrator 1 complex subunit 3 n=1 Tax=Anguilla anguilla TaxID=7936 RepID=A0A9D3N115_ANGAN|nr:hypothetical protein ANANG_G00012670 [Anguilla anguilla]